MELQAIVSLSPLEELQLILTSELHLHPLQTISIRIFLKISIMVCVSCVCRHGYHGHVWSSENIHV